MKYFLVIFNLTLLSFASNPFDTLDQKYNHPIHSKRFNIAYQLALKGNIHAQFNVAMMYGTGKHVTKNIQQAFNWLHKSAFNGHIQAKYLIGLSFKQGIGVKVDRGLAKYWFKKAAKSGHPRAIAQLQKLKNSHNK